MPDCKKTSQLPQIRLHTFRNLEEESKLIEAGFEYVRYSEKDGVAIYRKRK
ncbi:MAG: hypothetical protein QXX51_05570 [Candidatus Bathyarchaeia archaeon]